MYILSVYGNIYGYLLYMESNVLYSFFVEKSGYFNIFDKIIYLGGMIVK